MKRIKAYYTVETTLVMSVLIMMIFSVITCTLKLYGKVEAFSEKCITEVQKCGVTGDTMRLERLMSGAKGGK